jgi:DNA transformation protein and related proteins
MSTKQDTVDFICEQSGLPGRISARRMFGEFALYVDGKVIGLVCDDTLYIKPTEPGRAPSPTSASARRSRMAN